MLTRKKDIRDDMRKLGNMASKLMKDHYQTLEENNEIKIRVNGQYEVTIKVLCGDLK